MHVRGSGSLERIAISPSDGGRLSWSEARMDCSSSWSTIGWGGVDWFDPLSSLWSLFWRGWVDWRDSYVDVVERFSMSCKASISS